MLHVVLGEGQMTKRDLDANMADLMSKVEEGESFWFIVHAKPEPTATDQALMTWISDNNIYFEVIGDDIKGADAIYKDAQDRHEVKQLSKKIVTLLNEKPDEGEKADLLALFVSEDPDAEEDRWLNEAVQAVIEAGFPVLALNDGLVEIGLDEPTEDDEADEVEEAEVVEPEPAPAPVKAAAKKAPPKLAAVPDEQPQLPGLEDEPADWNRERLEEIAAGSGGVTEIKKIAGELGITLPPRTRASTYIDKILGEEDDAPEAEVSEVGEVTEAFEVQEETAVSSNGDSHAIDIDTLADAVADRIFNLLREALSR